MSYYLSQNCLGNIYLPPPLPVQSNLNICISDETIKNVTDPEVWGPAFWLTIHMSSHSAPENINNEDVKKYWGFIESLPLIIPCARCKGHAQAWVDQHRSQWRTICASKDNLSRFFSEFHNEVNRRTGKPEMSLTEIQKMFTGEAKISKVSYF